MNSPRATPLVPLTDKVTREPADHPQRVPVDKTPHPVTARTRGPARGNTSRPN